MKFAASLIPRLQACGRCSVRRLKSLVLFDTRMGGNFGGGGGNHAGFGPGNIGSPSRSGSLAGVFGGQQPQQQQQAGQGHVGPPQSQQPGMQQPPTLSQPQQQQAQQQHQHMSGELMSMLDGRGPSHTSQGSLASAVIGKYSQPPSRQVHTLISSVRILSFVFLPRSNCAFSALEMFTEHKARVSRPGGSQVMAYGGILQMRSLKVCLTLILCPCRNV